MSELAAVLASLPPAASIAGVPAAGTVVPARTIVAAPPPALAALAAGQVFRGVSVGRTADGRTLVETRFGRLALDLAEPPARGATLRLEVTRPGVPLELRAGAPVEAATMNGRNATAPHGLAAGATVAGRFAADGAAPTSEDRIVLRILAVGDGARAQPAGTLTGMVATSPAGGPTTIRIATGTISLPDLGGAATGIRLALQLVATPGTVAPPVGPSGARAVADLAGGWPALGEALVPGPGATPAPLVASVPQTGPALAAGLALFLQALRGGVASGWPGTDALDALARAGRRPLGERLEQDFGRLARLATEPAGDGWRVALVPLLDDGRLDQLRVYLRGGRDAEDGEGDLRFVVEAALSRLGRIQFDGLVAGQRFDLLIRTFAPLPATMRADIGEIFERVSAAASSGGALRFQVVTAFPVAPLESSGPVAAGVFA